MDFDKIRELAQILKASSLTRLRVEEDGTVLELEAEPPQQQVVSVAPVAATPATPAPEQEPSATPAPAAPQAEEDADAAFDMSKLTLVKAPMVGVFYAAPSPGAEPFVHVGSKVKKGDTLCVMEAMKLMNEVTAECDGEVVDICVEDGDLVEFGGTLMKIH
ncbi:acetyl-CoA carboxylase biotin carboxyl carrier protein [Olsenella profusa DSM 13989]|uniref:Biotin carboxyl carrier protein of acetyl-CoA carboxylase n=1 Tax=Olsenella profusa F0195 TaxID=1125712 RepID=U2UV26_9ACTN|nr:acetyl-CoA carboxylase biotin carboxyl carrier protein [Olsenella profusa]ERL06982.1 acetyl-CoA carboxylase, biotin carboxyl carrier protein [Olsenella profusa F0195]MDP9858407.1 acetyl-CoA carboxylase biotin carboxyl carrier protein [Olsenella profusa DSM 13989]